MSTILGLVSFGRDSCSILFTLKSVADELPEPRFMRVHKSFIANLEKVLTINGNQLLIGDYKVPMSRSKVGEVTELIMGGKLLG